MTNKNNKTFSAASSLLGYLFQCQFALFECLKRIRKGEDFSVSLETLDDVVFSKAGSSYEILQTKHHINKKAKLTNNSTDLWKSLRVWCEGIDNGLISCTNTIFCLATTSISPKESIAYYLKIGSKRSVNKALQMLNSIAESSATKTNQKAYASYRKLNLKQKKQMLKSTFVFDQSPSITDLDLKLEQEVHFASRKEHLQSIVSRLKGWWYSRIVKELSSASSFSILSEEIEAEIHFLSEQYQQDNLPIYSDEELLDKEIELTGFQNRVFVKQLELAGIGHERLLLAIRNYLRAYSQRSRWVREKLIMVGDLERYENKLVEEWELHFLQMKDRLKRNPTEQEKIEAAQLLYEWVENNSHPKIRERVTEAFVPRGTYQILSDDQKVGWHLEFKNRLMALLKDEKVTE